jgi:hypothetical protein
MSRRIQPADIEERRLTGHLAAQPEWGACVGFWATTYEFGAEHFEIDFLPALLGLGAWDDQHWTTRVAIERELGKMDAAAVLLDTDGYRGRPRSLRVEVLPGKGERGQRLHAKVLVAIYEKAVRLVVGSANLTQPGYRENIEVAADLVATARQPETARLIAEALEGAAGLLSPWPATALGILKAKATELLRGFEAPTDEEQDWFCWGGGAVPVWEQFVARWPSGEEARKLTIVSPFWSEAGPGSPLDRLLSELGRRSALAGGARVDLLTAGIPLKGDVFRPVLPPGYAGFRTSLPGVEVWAHSVNPHVLPEEVQSDSFTGTRRLHAKVVLLEGPETSLLYLGSANFTARGWGFDVAAANIEAGLILRRTGGARKALGALVPGTIGPGVRLDTADAGAFVAPEQKATAPSWPPFVKDIRLTPTATDREVLELVVTVDTGAVAGLWHIQTVQPDGGSETMALVAAPEPSLYRATLTPALLRLLLIEQAVRVCWWACEAGVDVPLNVDAVARDGLPVSAEAGKPAEEMLLAYYQGRIAYAELFPPADAEAAEAADGDGVAPPPGGVDTSGIQSYQIREFVEALDGIREDLKEAQHVPRAMRQALLGPVSPVALSQSVVARVEGGRRSAMAGAFQLVELQALLGGLEEWPARATWTEHLQKARGEVAAALSRVTQAHDDVRQSSVFRRYAREILGGTPMAEGES